MRLLLIGMFTLLTSVGASANTLSCYAQVLRTVCGSGKINIEIDLDKTSFTAKMGAVACWGYDISVNGNIKKIKGSYPFGHEDNYKLFHIGEDREEVLVATLIVHGGLLANDIVKPALLEMKKTSFRGYSLYREQFNLICTE
jgi:hypothetical protein